MEFWKIYRIVKARRWMILGLLLITLATVYLAKKAVDEGTQYVANSVVLPSPQAYSPSGFYQDNKGGAGGVLSPTYGRLDRMAQFIQNIKLKGVQTAFDLAETKGPDDQKRALVLALLDQLPPNIASTVRDPKALRAIPVDGAGPVTLNKILEAHNIPTDDAIWTQRSIPEATKQQIESGLFAQPVREAAVDVTPGQTATPITTDYLQIVLHAADPNEATQLANLIAASFINNYKDEGLGEYNNTIASANDQQRKDKHDLAVARQSLTEFRQKQPYVELPTAANVAIGNLVALQHSRDQAEIQLKVAQKSAAEYERLAEARGPSNVLSLDPRSRPHYQQLQEEIADAQANLDALGTDLTPDNPRYQKAKAVLDSRIKERDAFLKQPYISVTPNPEYQGLKTQADQASAEAARAQETIANLDTQIAQQRAQNQGLPALENELATLVENVNQALTRVHADNQAVTGLETNNTMFKRGLISLVQAAASATPDSSGPGLTSLLIYGAILSLFLGIAAAVGLDYLDNSVQTIPDAEKLLGMPVSAVIPAMPPGDPRRQTRLTVSDPLSPIAESYRLLRTDLLFTAEEKPFKSLMAATAKPGQGATTTICNLAVALASVGKRVILIDADLRRPKLHGFFNVSNETGLTSLLRDECELEEALKVTDIDNLLVLPSGPLPLNPAELLASQKMRALHERLKPHTDFVLVDTPSAIAFSDSSILASYLDAVMIVVRAQETPRGSEIQLKNLLNKARANVIGVVLNGVKPQLVDSYYYHAAYYPQVTPSNGHALGLASGGGVLPPPNGSNGNGVGHKTHERTLEGEDVGTAVSAGPAQDIEATTVMDGVPPEDIVTVTPAKPRSRFSLRRRSGDDRN